MKTCLTIAAGSLLMLAAACGDTNADSGVAPEDLTDEQLGLMVLPQEAFGVEYAGLGKEDSSGPENAAGFAEDTIEPNDAAGDMGELGFVTGYEVTFSDPTVLESGEPGVLSVGSEVDLFTASETIPEFVRRQMMDGERLVDRDIGGATLVSFFEFKVDRIGDEAFGYTSALDIDGQLIYKIVIGFRDGPLLASVTMCTSGSGDLRSIVTDWAEQLEARVQGVLEGTITEAG